MTGKIHVVCQNDKGFLFIPELENVFFPTISVFEDWREGSFAKALIKRYNIRFMQLQLTTSETFALKDYHISEKNN